jgi:hypothetical protein
VGRKVAGQQGVTLVYRLSGWDHVRYVAYGLRSPDIDLITSRAVWRVKQGQWTRDHFDTSRLFYRPGYRSLVGKGCDDVALHFVVEGTPGREAIIELGSSALARSDRPDPLTEPITLEAGGRRLIAPRDSDAVCRYFARKPLVAPPRGRARFADKLTPRECTRRADDMLMRGRYQLGTFPPVALPGDPTWHEDPFDDPNWQFLYHSLSFLEAPLGAFQATGDRRYLDMATRIAADWFGGDMVDSDLRLYTWNDAATAVRLITLLDLWEVYRTADPAPGFLCDLLRAIWLHGKVLASPDFYAKDQPTQYHNHAFFQDAALVAAAYVLPELSEAKQWLDLGARRARQQVERTVTEEGVHVEHSPSYHLAVMRHTMALAEMLEALRPSEAAYFSRQAGRMERFMACMTAPDGTTPLFGDSSRVVSARSKHLQGLQPEPCDAVFPASGYAFFRDRWGHAADSDQTTYIAFTAAYNSTTHKHLDDLSFVAYALGEWWLIDPGLYTYKGDDPLYAWARSFPAHNTLVVDGYTPQVSEADVGKSRIARWGTGESVSYVKAQHTLVPGVTVRRSLYYLKPNVLLMLDEIESPNSHSVLLPLHFAPQHVLQSHGRGQWTVRSRKTGRTMRVRALWPNLQAQWVKGQTAPEIQGWSFPQYHVRVAAPVLELRTQGRTLRLLTVIELPSDSPGRHSLDGELGRRMRANVELQPLLDLWDQSGQR